MLEGLDLMRLVDDGATVARQPPVVMQDAPVGRGGDEPDGGRDRHDGPATPCAGMLTGRALRAREHRLSFRVTPTVATSQIPMCCLGYGRVTPASGVRVARVLYLISSYLRAVRRLTRAVGAAPFESVEPSVWVEILGAV